MGLAGGFGAVVEFLVEDFGKRVEVLEQEGEDDVDVPGHPGLGVMVEGHRAGEHGFQTGIFLPPGDVEEEIEFREHGDLIVFRLWI